MRRKEKEERGGGGDKEKAREGKMKEGMELKQSQTLSYK